MNPIISTFLSALSLLSVSAHEPFPTSRNEGAKAMPAAEKNTLNKRPNIILILADDLGFETLGCYGGTSFKTPNLDKMARQGIRFENCYSQPLCTPSRLQLMTGKYNFRNYEKFGYLNQNETTFAHVLKSVGYSTCIAGKWQLRGDEFAPYKSGFDEYCLWQITFSSYNERYKNPKIVQNGKLTKYTKGEFGEDIFSRYLMDFMERHKDGPFLIYYPMVLTHAPFVPTPGTKDYDAFNPEKDKSDKIYFKDEVAYMDKVVGDISNKIRELNISENTLILFTGDNGTGGGVVSMIGDKKIPGMKGSVTEYGRHVPLIAMWNGKIKPGQVNEDLIDFTDFLPTLCDAVNIKLPETFITDGFSFFPQLINKKSTPREWSFCNFRKKRFIHNKEWKLYDTGEIFNIKNDPFEKTILTEKDLDTEQKALMVTFRDVMGKMHVKVVEKKEIKEDKEE
jgi:arylsulfatase A